ncbi:YgaP family membrane protein [Herpetosiphon giganteus]|uniref:YgaP family membrane protein n=1 Tax=Herpetosiphon giganteus TaxID=2029754 RepID=UPI001957D5DD|nr:DUF2892 domain-containing protein [Herpetosiphon giganteus]MBM7841808.1 hypothetical protein [Herpetosiphon giganteus]
MLYRKNLPSWERWVRSIVALALVGVALWLAPTAIVQWLSIISALVLLVTGMVGYCPACHLMGRKPQ